MVIVYKNNSSEIRAKIIKAGLQCCKCTLFNDSVWLSYTGITPNTVHGIGYYREDIGTKSIQEELARFESDNPEAIYCDNVEEFINRIRNSKMLYDFSKPIQRNAYHEKSIEDYMTEKERYIVAADFSNTKDKTVESTLSLEFLDNPFEDINRKSSDITLKITRESHEVTEEVDGQMQTFKCFPVEEIPSETKKCYDFKEPLSEKEIEVIANIQTNLAKNYMNNK